MPVTRRQADSPPKPSHVSPPVEHWDLAELGVMERRTRTPPGVGTETQTADAHLKVQSGTRPEIVLS